MKRWIAAGLGAAVLALMPAIVSANGLTQDQLDEHGWTCAADAGLPPGHCVNPGTGNGPGQTMNVMVFDADGHRHATETVTVHANAGERPCPHDEESPDGTWWNPEGTPPILQVCHHQ